MKIYIDTLGCKLNQAETELLASRFIEAGYMMVSSIEEADIYILNTCTVTQTADAKSRQLLRHARRKNPKVMLAAAGCYVRRAPEALAHIDGVIATADNDTKLKLPEILAAAGYPGSREITDSGIRFVSRTRATIKIQDGCSNFCSYCIVPFVRGIETSIPADQVIKDIRHRVSDGVKEVILTGTEIGLYNHDGIDLFGLIKRVLSETGVIRLRLSSLQPDEITPELISLWDDNRLCRHFHLSLQSGSDTVLRRMNRRYTLREYLSAVSLIKSHLPDAAITTDIIAGFPGETEQEYEESLKVCRETGFARIHVFPFSKRPGTAAARMPEQAADSIKTQRSRNLRVISRECAESYRQKFTGSVMDVLWEHQSGGSWSGYTGNYIRVYSGSKEDLTNRITPVRLLRLYKDGMWGETV